MVLRSSTSLDALRLCRTPVLTEWSRVRGGARGAALPSSRCRSGLPPCSGPSGFVGAPGHMVFQGRPSGGPWVQAGRQPSRPQPGGGGRLSRPPLLRAGLQEPGSWSQGLILGGGRQVCRSRSQAHPSFVPEWAGGRRRRRLTGLCGKSQPDPGVHWPRGPWLVPGTGSCSGEDRGLVALRSLPRWPGTEAVVSTRMPASLVDTGVVGFQS